MDQTEIAHVLQFSDGTWAPPHLLEDHLDSVSQLAASFASSFASAHWAALAGIAHDIGKSTPQWQQYIRDKSGYESSNSIPPHSTLDHSSSSAALLEKHLPLHIARLLSYVVAGHHTGLPDWIGSAASLEAKLQQGRDNTASIPESFFHSLNTFADLTLPIPFKPYSLDLSFWIRMIFSCLVDADFLNTESYMQADISSLRNEFLSIPELQALYESCMENLTRQNRIKGHSIVNQIRNQVFSDCLAAAHQSSGFFSLTVPTGGGKTLSSLGFGLKHACIHGYKRIIYVIPYTSIIEQTADVFRSIFGDDEVVEHHSNFDQEFESPKIRLASENWDAPIIVTTNVQFFESLFAAKPSRCRKLHNITESVIIFDEAQLLPPEYLHPILESLQQLITHYHTSIVFCTATQPAFERSSKFPSFPGLDRGSIREIVDDFPSLYAALQRVEFEVLKSNVTTWQELATQLMGHEQVLCIVSERKSCRELFSLMPKGTIHLSALMCPAHRSAVIASIKETLSAGMPIRVISTQLVEAGVDIDFPVVFRAVAGIDSIAQAAGRCNREGRLKDKKGLVVIFHAPRKPPSGLLLKGFEITDTMIRAKHEIQFLDPQVYTDYFATLFWKVNSLEENGILKLLQPDSRSLGIQFRSAANAFTLIDDQNSKSILIPYEKGESLINQLEQANTNPVIPTRKLFRQLQRYAVTIYTNQFHQLLDRGSLKEVYPQVFALACGIEYDDTIGLLVEEIPSNPMSYIG